MHFYSFNIKEYTHATVHLSNEECLAYRRLLDISYDTEAPLAADTKLLARRVRCAATAVQAVLEEFFILTDEGWVHPRVQRELDEVYAKSAKAKQSAALSVQSRRQRTNAQRTLNESSTSVELPNTQDTVPNTQKEKKETASPVFPPVLDTEEFRASWNGYMTYRRQMKFKTLKSASVTAKFQEMESWGHDLAIEAIKNSIRNGWQGIFPPFQNQGHQAPTTTDCEYAHAF